MNRVLPRPDTFGSSAYSCGSYFHKGIQIGGNISGAQELIDKIIFIGSLFNGKLNYNNSDTKPTFKISLGTNFSIYGIG